MIRNSEHKNEDKRANIEIPYSSVFGIVENNAESALVNPARI
jgi:hypothetical protein